MPKYDTGPFSDIANFVINAKKYRKIKLMKILHCIGLKSLSEKKTFLEAICHYLLYNSYTFYFSFEDFGK